MEETRRSAIATVLRAIRKKPNPVPPPPPLEEAEDDNDYLEDDSYIVLPEDEDLTEVMPETKHPLNEHLAKLKFLQSYLSRRAVLRGKTS